MTSNIRTRTRGTQTTNAPANNSAADEGDAWWQEGEEGFSTAEKLQQGKKPYASRFYLKVDETADIVLLDEGKGFFIHEYEIYDQARKRMFHETVRKDIEYDPLEQLVGVDTRFKDASYVMYLTCIDLRPFVDRNNNQRYFAKKLLPVKRAQMKKFKRYLEQHGTYRGMMLKMIRDDAKQAKIGDPEFMMYDPAAGKALLTEDDIIENFGGPAVLGQDRKTVVKAENADCYAFDYKTVLAPSPVDELARRWGAPLNPGSQQANQQMMSRPQAQQQSRPVTQRPAAAPPPLLNKARTAAPAEAPAQTAEAPASAPVRQRGRLVPNAAETTPVKTRVTKPAAQAEDEVPFETDEVATGAAGAETEEWYEGDEGEE